MSYTFGTVYTYSSFYSWNGTDTIQDMVNFFRNDIRTNAVGFNAYTSTDNDPDNTIPLNTIGITVNNLIIQTINLTVTIVSSSPSVSDVDIGGYKHKARYSFVLNYFDDFGVTDGSQYEASSMALLMPEQDTTGGTEMKIPQITFNIFHQPPIWATKFSWARSTNLTFLSSIDCISDTTKKDSTLAYAYLEITSLQNNTSNFSAYEFLDGDRVRILGLYVLGSAGTVINSGSGKTLDFPIVSLLVNPTINGIAYSANTFIKIPYDSSLVNFNTTGFDNYYIEIYTPAPNTNSTQQIFFEFGENYPVLNAGTANRAHGGMTQDQIFGTQPAIYNFVRGDYYIRTRTYSVTNSVPTTFLASPTWIMDQSVSDLYPSQVQGIGRPFVIDPNAKQTYFPTLIRFGGAYQQDTNVNQTNIFFPTDFDEYPRDNGDVRKLFIEGNYLYVFHKFEVGIVPVYMQIIQDTEGNPLQANSTTLLNKIMYPYKGKYGIGDIPECFAYHGYAKYFIDPYKGVCVRLSQDGMTELSVLYECNSFFVNQLKAYAKTLNTGIPPQGGVYTGDPTVYGCFDFFTNKYIIAFENITRYNYVIVAPTTAPIATLAAGGLLTVGNTYSYEITFVNGLGQESPVSLPSNSQVTDLSNRTINLTAIPISSDPTVTARRIYRTLGTSGVYNQIAQINDNTTTTYSNNAETDLGGSPDAATKVIFQQNPVTIIFNETRDQSEGFECKTPYYPEGMESLGTLLVSFKNGQLWTHNNPVYCNFYGTQYDAYIEGVFNDSPLNKKTWQTLEESASDVWECDEITTELMSYGSTPQQSNLIPQDFKLLEGKQNASFLRDSNSIGGVLNGDYLKGSWIKIRLTKKSASNFVFLNSISAKWVESAITPK